MIQFDSFFKDVFKMFWNHQLELLSFEGEIRVLMLFCIKEMMIELPHLALNEAFWMFGLLKLQGNIPGGNFKTICGVNFEVSMGGTG